MKNFALIFLIVFIFANCKKSQITHVSQDKSQTKPIALPTQKAGTGQSGGDQGNPKFSTTGIKYYVGCWKPEKEFKPYLETKSDVFNITEKTIQTSKMREPVDYEEINSKGNSEYFVLHLKSKVEGNKLNPYVYVFMPLEKEMTLSSLENFATEDNIKEQSTNQWHLRKGNCAQLFGSEKK